MAANIFLSYRRRESSKDARAIYERLRQEFGVDGVFMDLEDIRVGEDFADKLERQLDGCKVLVALIGRGWLKADPRTGKARLGNEDYVRIEVQTAFKRGIRVLPVLIDGATMPDAHLLPTELRRLVRIQAGNLKYDSFDSDIGALVAAIRETLGQPAPPDAHQDLDPRSHPQGSDAANWLSGWSSAMAPNTLVQPILPGWTTIVQPILPADVRQKEVNPAPKRPTKKKV